MFSEKARTIVLFTLGMGESPMSIDDISFRTGLGYNTVKRVVLGDNRVQKIPGKPAKYHTKMPEGVDSDLFVVQYEQPEQGWEAWLEEIRPLLPSIASMPDEMSTSEQLRKVAMFKSLGTSFLSLAKDMESVDG
jgi:hypothetical protein